MIMTIRANGWKALFVPTARLEFRITEFSWRDIPYFMYKRSEATAHGTRDYLMAKWQANFPNTGFWTYIKYTIVEQHVYGGLHLPDDAYASKTSSRDVLTTMRWKDQALLVFGFFQMAGFNRYALGRDADKRVDFLDVLQRLDKGWSPGQRAASIRASRKLERPTISKTNPAYVSHLDEILPYGVGSHGPVKAEIEHEYLPFSLAKLTLGSCAQMNAEIEAVCGIVVQEADGSCVCWINMPTFKSNSLVVRVLGHLAALIKVPSRVTTFIEMALSGSRNGTEHVLPLRGYEGASFQLVACDIGETDCSTSFSFAKDSKLVLFRGEPATVPSVQGALRAI